MLRTLPYSQLPTPRSALWPRFPATMLAMATAALRDSLAASRQYQRLRSRGVGHDAAIRDAFGVGPASSQAIHFAGRM
jgi:hypothetical protein